MNKYLFARIALFVIFFWFGFLKIIDVSPANPLVAELQQKTIPFLSTGQFTLLFGMFEMLIGAMFLFKKLDRFTFIFFFMHMATTFMPLIFLPEIAWQKFMVPTLEGQYIIKNLALLGLVIFLRNDKDAMSQ